MTDEPKPKEEMTGRERQLAALKEHQGATQFGKPGGNKQAQDAGGNKPWSIRNSIRHIASQPIDPAKAKSPDKLLPENATLAQRIALNVLLRASKTDMRAAEIAIEQIDGKVAQTNINADLAVIQRMSDDELRDYERRINEELAALEAVDGEDGAVGAAPEEGTVAPGAGLSDQTGNTGGV